MGTPRWIRKTFTLCLLAAYGFVMYLIGLEYLQEETVPCSYAHISSLDNHSTSTHDNRTMMHITLTFPYPLDINMMDIVNRKERNEPIDDIKVINSHPFNYILNSKVCDSDFSVSGQQVSLLILVKSAAGYFKKRNTVRQTWGKVNSEYIRLVFLLGASSKEDQEKIEEENKIYSDIVQEDFKDSYKNNTYKTIMGYNWAVQYCEAARYLFFVDDDVLVNVTNLIKYLVHSGSDDMYTGLLLPLGIPYRRNSKWFMSYKEYPFEIYPPYIPGGAYLISMKYARMFHYVFPYIKYIFVDDVYIGIVALKLGIQMTNNTHIKLAKCNPAFLQTGFACHKGSNDTN